MSVSNSYSFEKIKLSTSKPPPSNPKEKKKEEKKVIFQLRNFNLNIPTAEISLLRREGD